MKYDDIVANWNTGKEKWQLYKTEISRFVDRLYEFFLSKLEFSQEVDKRKYLKFVPLEETNDERLQNIFWSSQQCISFIEGGWATIGIRLLLETSQVSREKMQLIFHLYIKKNNQNWALKFGQGAKIIVFYDLYNYEQSLDKAWTTFSELIEQKTLFDLENWLGQDEKNL